MRYENFANEVIKVDLHNNFEVIGMAKWNKEKNTYLVSLYMKRKDIDTFRLLEDYENIILDADRKSIKLEMLRYIKKINNDHCLEKYKGKIDFEDRCFNIGLNTLEEK